MPAPGENGLSERELEILKLMATGAANKEIARRLFISTNTVKVHLQKIFTKLGVSTRTEAAMYAVRTGLIKADRAADVNVLLSERGSRGGDTFSVLAESREESTVRVSERQRRLLAWLAVVVFLIVLVAIVYGLIYLNQFNIPAGQLTASTPTPDTRWQLLANLPTARYSLAVVAYEDQIYAIGGETAQGTTGVVERFDPKTNYWTTFKAKPLPVSEAGAAVIGGLVYVPGGRTQSGAPTDVLEVYDPRQDRWESRSSMPVALNAYGLVAFEGRIYLFGGWDGQRYVNSVYTYDPSRDMWEAMTPMPTARGYAGAALAAGKIYVIGGFNGNEALRVNEVYLPDRDGSGEAPWEAAALLPEGRYGMGVVSVADLIQVIGGEGEGEGIYTLLAYNPQGNLWQQIDSPRLTQSWSYMGLVSLTTLVYTMGGKLDAGPSAQNLAYQAVFTVAIPLVR